VSPRQTEECLMGVHGIDLPVVVGAARKAAIALIFASSLPEKINDRKAFSQRLWSEIQDRMQALPEYQRVAGLIIVSRAPSIAEGEITTNLKLRRKAIEAIYARAIDSAFTELDRAGGRTDSHAPLVTYL